MMKRLTLLVAAVALLAAACGDSGDSSNPEGVAATVAPSTTAPETTRAPETTVPETTAPETTMPETTAPETTVAEAPAIVPGEDPDVDEVVMAYTIAFDSTSGYEAKAPYIEDPTGLEETVASYLEIGTAMGGVGVSVTGVEIDGDTAAVSYDLLFNGNPTYPDLSGSAVRTAEGWQIPRDVFCGLMSSARVGCPSE
jgi:hypothetical protein